MSASYKIRFITLADASAVLEIYKPYVLNTYITFEYEVPAIEEWQSKIKKIMVKYPWLVCEYQGEIVGYAYGSTHRDRTAYQWSAESTVYLPEKFHRRGIAGALYETLFAMLKLQGYVNVYAGVGLPNNKSEEFHKALGFSELGIFKNIGYKLGTWHDTKWFQLHLTDHIKNPPAPKTIAEINETSDFLYILEQANFKLNNKVVTPGSSE
jgi:phosphinothricin acetyltransferase